MGGFQNLNFNSGKQENKDPQSADTPKTANWGLFCLSYAPSIGERDYYL